MEAISEAQYDKFVNTGQVDDIVVLEIAKKVSVHSDLTEYEYAVFSNKVEEINKILVKNKNKTLDKWEF